MTDMIFDLVRADEIPAALEIERQGYPEDEAGTETSFRLRQSQAGDLFLGAYLPSTPSRTLIAYICSTLSPSPTLTHSTMSTHVPGASSVCIHSVCVAPSYKRRGVGLALLKAYIAHLQSSQAGYQRVLLIAHEELRAFYEKAGFEWVGRSEVVHGARAWFEMRKKLASPPSSHINSDFDSTSTDSENQPTTLPPGILEALTRKRPIADIPSARLLSEFPNSVLDVQESDPNNTGCSVNKYDLLCPRKECGSIIIKRGVGQWVERDSLQLEPPNTKLPPFLPPLPAPPSTAQWWLVRESPMKFENVGFTRPAQPVASGPKLKLLTCGECDLGPLGWCEEGGSEYWLVCSRVAYRS